MFWDSSLSLCGLRRSTSAGPDIKIRSHDLDSHVLTFSPAGCGRHNAPGDDLSLTENRFMRVHSCFNHSLSLLKSCFGA